jgi:hypothetical protein
MCSFYHVVPRSQKVHMKDCVKYAPDQVRGYDIEPQIGRAEQNEECVKWFAHDLIDVSNHPWLRLSPGHTE